MTLMHARLLAWLGILALAVAVPRLLVLLARAHVQTRSNVWWHYVTWLDERLRFVRADVSGHQVACAQLALIVITAVLAFALRYATLCATWPLITALPWWWIDRATLQRRQQIEDQLDTWLLTLANGLKAVPSLGEAMASSVALIGGPLAQELTVALREHALGSPLNEALRALAARVQSPVLTAAVTTLEVARRTGGALSQTLEQAAASLREMARLHQVVRTKTADSRAQAWVISAVPALLLLVLHRVCPDVIDALMTSGRGHVVLAIAGAMWAAAIVSAIKILDVDL